MTDDDDGRKKKKESGKKSGVYAMKKTFINK
jgi:hypothetical protein